MQVSLADYTQDAEQKIGKFAAICYDADDSTEACARRVRSCMSKGHLSTLRFAYATFKIEGISRACSHQLVRHKFLDYLQESQRYVSQENCQFIFPSNLTLDQELYLKCAYEGAVRDYKRLIDFGVKKEDARFVLPQATTTSLYVTGNFQAWKDFLKLRQDKSAQWEIRQVANEVAKELYKIAPTIFKEEYEKAMST